MGQTKPMKNKRITICIVLLFLMFSVARAQTDFISSNSEIKNNETGALYSPKDSSEMKSRDAAREERMKKVWKRHARYFNIAYGLQTLENSETDMESDMAFSISMGRTFYLHKKPIAGLLKFGLDWSCFDINFAKYPDLETSENTQPLPPDIEIPDLGIMQMEAGMGLGPSLTINPVDRFKISLYFHVTPSYSLLLQNHEIYHHYATFFNAGFTLAYKVISLGIENRWCGDTPYDGVTLTRIDNVYDAEGNFHDPFESFGLKMKTQTLRFFVGFRF